MTILGGIVVVAFLVSQFVVVVLCLWCYRVLQNLIEQIPQLVSSIRRQGTQEVFAAFLEGVNQVRRLDQERLEALMSDSELQSKLKKPARKHV